MSPDLFSDFELLLDSRPDPKTSGLRRMTFIKPDLLLAVASHLLEAGYHLEDISALDAREGFLVTYHFDRCARPAGIERIAVRVLATHEDARLPSIAAVFDGAEWHEREISDFFGVRFDGNPNPATLLLPEADTSTPLCKTAERRRALGELIDPGRIVFKASGFELFDAD